MNKNEYAIMLFFQILFRFSLITNNINISGKVLETTIDVDVMEINILFIYLFIFSQGSTSYAFGKNYNHQVIFKTWWFLL